MTIPGFLIGKLVDLAHRSPKVAELAFSRLGATLNRSYEATKDSDEELALRQAFGRSLQPFLSRLIRERPAAAKAVIRFAYGWARDVRRRSARLGQGHCTPATVVIEPTDRCNLNCPGCYARSARHGSDLSYELIREIIRQAREMGTTLITLTGGEPFLRERSDQTISRLAGEFPELGFLIYTNGTLIDDAVAARLGACGNVFPAISLEGGETQTDARRSDGTYKSSHLAREQLAAHEVMYGFSATATRENCDALADERFIDDRLAAGDLFGWYFIYQPIGRAPKPELMVSARQRLALHESIVRARQQAKPIFLGDFWNDGALTGGCIAAGRYYFHVYANGDISPCVFCPVACGNVYDIFEGRSEYADLSRFIEQNPVCQRYREAQAKIHDHRAPCVLIDHPELFSRVVDQDGWKPGKNFSPAYLSGPVRQAVERAAVEWKQELQSRRQEHRAG